MEILALIIGLILLASCGAFVAAEFSLITVNRNDVEAAAESGDKRSQGVLKAMKTMSTQLSGAQLGITVTNLGIGFLAEPAIANIVDGPLGNLGLSEAGATTVSVTIALVLATALTMIFGELIPKNLAIARPLATARAVQGFQRGFTKSTAYLIRLFNGTANRVVRLLGFEPQEELASARSPEELLGLVRHSARQGALAVDTAELVERSFAFGDRRANDVMTPRGQILSLDPDDSVHELLIRAKATGHSRFPIIGGDGEGTVLGLVHVRHALAVPYLDRDRVTVGQVMGPVTTVPDTVELDGLMDTLRHGGLQMAVLIDEFGDTAGLVTLEDLVEELVGEVRDEHDPVQEVITSDADGAWDLEASLRPDEASEHLGVFVPEHEEYDTLAGLVTLELGRLARVGDTIEIASEDVPGAPESRIRFDVTAMDDHRIDRVRVLVRTLDADAERTDSDPAATPATAPERTERHL
ncbi:HlyC/CorC family transporter [Cryobacterium frigoriphilum]|uniref:HlyC/CorC family transporter n=1 Tax=Cryobacterium frigoriphilum TaxID=1259150 RepID=A0A4R9A608_9MICO|nr:hemolysin family protein [Cryobacterium frigoriphilum]TFD52948.1 HlyC/CorC family transporter [Cryobacterium frigoriphilum]